MFEDKEQLHKEEIPKGLDTPLENTTKKKKKEIVPEYVSYKDVELTFAKKPFNFKKLFYTIILFLFLSMFFVAGIVYIKNKKNVYRTWLNQETKYVTTKGSELIDHKFFKLSKNTPFMTSVIVDFESEYANDLVSRKEKNLLDTFKNINSSFSLGMDLKEKKLTYSLKSTHANQNLFSFYGNGTEDEISIFIREVTGKYITLPNHFRFLLQENTKQQAKDLETIRKYMVNFVLSYIEEADLQEEKVSLKVDGKEENVRAITLVLSKEKLEEMRTTLFHQLETNKIFKEKLAFYFQITEEQLKIYIEQMKRRKLSSFNIKLYAKGITNKIVGYQIQFGDKEIYQFSKMGVKKKTYRLEKGQDVLFDFTKEDDRFFGTIFEKKVKMVKTTPNTYTYSVINSNDSYIGTLTWNDTEKALSKQGNIDLTVSHRNKEEQEIANLRMFLTYSAKTQNSLSLHNDTMRIPYKDLSKIDKQEIKNRIQKGKEFQSVLQTIKAYCER